MNKSAKGARGVCRSLLPLLCAGCTFLLNCSEPTKTFTVTIDIVGCDSGTAELVDDNMDIDSVLMVQQFGGGQIVFSGTDKDIGFDRAASLVVRILQWDKRFSTALPVLLEYDSIHITARYEQVPTFINDSFKFSGTDLQEDYDSYLRETMAMYLDYDSTVTKAGKLSMSGGGPTRQDSMQRALDSILKKIIRADESFDHKYPMLPLLGTFVSGLIGRDEIHGDHPLVHYADSISHELDSRFPTYKWGMLLRDAVRAKRDTLLNQPAPDFALMDRYGQPFILSKYRGRYVLLEFWASWCTPCIKEFPALKTVHERYASDDFVMVGISIDKDTASWVKALERQELPWVNLIDNLRISTQVNRQYIVRSIPSNFLIDPEGTVIARDLGPDDLMATLSTLAIGAGM